MTDPITTDYEGFDDHTPIELLDFTVRTYNVLKREGVHTVGELAACTEDRLCDMRNLGLNSMAEIKQKLAKFRKSLRANGSHPVPPTLEPEVEHVTVYRWGQLIVTVYGDGSAQLSMKDSGGELFLPTDYTAALANIMALQCVDERHTVINSFKTIEGEQK